MGGWRSCGPLVASCPCGTLHGLSLPWNSLSPELLEWVWPLQNYPFKRDTFFFQLCKKGDDSLNFHAGISSESAAGVWGGFSFKNRTKVYLVCFAFFCSSPSPSSLMEQLKSSLKCDFKSQIRFFLTWKRSVMFLSKHGSGERT